MARVVSILVALPEEMVDDLLEMADDQGVAVDELVEDAIEEMMDDDDDDD